MELLDKLGNIFRSTRPDNSELALIGTKQHNVRFGFAVLLRFRQIKGLFPNDRTYVIQILSCILAASREAFGNLTKTAVIAIGTILPGMAIKQPPFLRRTARSIVTCVGYFQPIFRMLLKGIWCNIQKVCDVDSSIKLLILTRPYTGFFGDMMAPRMSKVETAASREKFNQNPHANREPRENNLEKAIGHEVREYRKKLGITVTDLSAATGISLGMLSKIENGNISPSLTTLQSLSRALGVPVTAFFLRFEEPGNATFIKVGQGLSIERRGTRAGHQYSLLGHIDNNTSGVAVEPYLITLTTESDVFPTFQHDGREFLYMLEGEVVYRHSDQLYHMQPGDSLFFDADAPHGPEELITLPSRYLSIIAYSQKRDS